MNSMPAASNEEIEKFVKNCEVTIERIKSNLEEITEATLCYEDYDDYKDDVCPYRKLWFDVYESIKVIYKAELMFLDGLKIRVRKRCTTKTELTTFNKFITKTDKTAKLAKGLCANAYMLSTSLASGRPELRELVRSHWTVYDEVKKNKRWPKDIKKKKERFLKQLCAEDAKSGALVELEWVWGIVVSFSRKDRADLKKLLEIIEPKLSEKHIHIWYDKEILTGRPWEKIIKTEFNRRDLAVTLVSEAFINKKSKFIHKVEVELLKSRRQDWEKGVVIYPIILEVCNWENHKWLKATQYLPANGKSIRKDFADKDKFNELGTQIACEIIDIMGKLSKSNKTLEFKGPYERT